MSQLTASLMDTNGNLPQPLPTHIANCRASNCIPTPLAPLKIQPACWTTNAWLGSNKPSVLMDQLHRPQTRLA
jgi:hypothetical protein